MTESRLRVAARLLFADRLRHAATQVFAPIDIAWLVYFRIAFGLLMFYEVGRFVRYDWVNRQLVEPGYHFKYLGFGWVEPLPASWMFVVTMSLGACALLIALGLLYRTAAVGFFTGFTYFFLIEKSRYLNHFYLIGLIGFLLILLPADRAGSLRTWFHPESRRSTVPAWSLWLLRFQIAVVYVYGGIAKLNTDWLSGQPLGIWLPEHPDLPLIGRFVDEPWLALSMSYAGLAFDLGIVPLLLVRRTRPLALVACVLFHALNAQLFRIGIFPWLALATTLLFLPPGWPLAVSWWVSPGAPLAASPPGPMARRVTLAFLLAYGAVQLLVPLRHWLYPGVTAWTQQAERFSWRMRLNHSRGVVTFYARDELRGMRRVIDPLEVLTPQQARDMAAQPDMILEFAHFLSDRLRSQGYGEAKIRCVARASWNGRPPELLIDPTLDLTDVESSLLPADFILPFAGGAAPSPGEPTFSFDKRPHAVSRIASLFGSLESERPR